MPPPIRPPKRPPPLPPPAAAAPGALFPVAIGVTVLLVIGAIGTGALLLIPANPAAGRSVASTSPAADTVTAPPTATERSAAAADIDAAAPAAAADAPAAAETGAGPNEPGVPPAVAEAEPTPDSPADPEERTNSTSAPATPAGRPLDDLRSRDLILDLPEVAAAAATSPAVLARIQGTAAELAALELELSGEAANGKRVVLQRAAGDAPPTWDVLVQRLDNLRPPSPLAQFILDGNELKFAWQASEAEPALMYSLLKVSAHHGRELDVELCTLARPLEIDPLRFDFSKDRQMFVLVADDLPAAFTDRLQLKLSYEGADEGVAIEGPDSLRLDDRTTIKVLDPEFGDEELFRIELTFSKDGHRLQLEVSSYLSPSWMQVESGNKPCKLSELSKLATQSERKADRLEQKLEREIIPALERAGISEGVSSRALSAVTPGAAGSADVSPLLEKRDELRDEINTLRELVDAKEFVELARTRFAADASVLVQLEVGYETSGGEHKVVLLRTRAGGAGRSTDESE